MYAQKRRVCITLELECYDDYPLEDLDWRDLLSLEGDERVNVNIDDIIDVFQCASFKIDTCYIDI